MTTHWTEKPLRELAARIFVGIASAATHAYRESGILLLRNLNIKEDGIDRSDLIYIDPQYEAQHARKRLKAGDVLTVRTGYAGVSAVLPEDLVNAQCFTALVTRPNAKVLDSSFLAYFLNSPIGEKAFTKSEAGGSQKNVNAGALEQLLVPIPALDEQRRIATAFQAWNTAIQKSEQLIAAKKRRHDWLLQRLINHHTARRYWKSACLGELILERSERSAQHNEYPVLTSSRRGLFLQSEYFSKQVTSENNTGYKIMRRGDFTFRSMSDDGRFVFNRLEKHDAGIISPAYGVFYAKGVDARFFAHFLNSAYFARLLARETQGGTRMALRLSALASIEVNLPEHADQVRIATILDKSLRDVDLLGKCVAALKTQKRGLMQKLLTGQWRFPVSKEAEVVTNA